jgi:hypothetical protein
MTDFELAEDEDMARRISERDIVRANLVGKPATKIVARAVEMEGEYWAAQFAVPGKVPDFSRNSDGTLTLFMTENDAYTAAMEAAIGLFNAPREHLRRFGGNRMGNAETGSVRPAKMTPAAMSAAMSAAELNSSDLVFLLDKPAKRILGWSNDGDIPHEVRLLLEIFAKFDETVDLAFEVTNQAIEDAGR